MSIAKSHGEAHAENYRARDLPATPDSAVTAPDRDPRTGRFSRGNAASRRRALKRLSRQLVWLDPEHVAEWARPYVGAARQHASDLLVDLGAVGPLASPIAEELATARLVYRALLQLGLNGDAKALEAARAWLRESRQCALALEGLARAQRGAGDPDDDLGARQRAFQAQLAQQQQQPAIDATPKTTPEGEL